MRTRAVHLAGALAASASLGLGAVAVSSGAGARGNSARDLDKPFEPPTLCEVMRFFVGHVPGHIASVWMLECTPTADAGPPTSGGD